MRLPAAIPLPDNIYKGYEVTGILIAEEDEARLAAASALIGGVASEPGGGSMSCNVANTRM